MTITIAITGHRPQHLEDYLGAEAKIREYYRDLYARLKPALVISGMALGVDQWAAEEALTAGVLLTAAVPFKAQAKFWRNPADVDRYLDILSRAHAIEVISENPASKWEAVALLQKRNEWMVNNCGLLAAVWDGTSGGTANCLRYARKRKCEIVRLNPRDWSVGPLTPA